MATKQEAAEGLMAAVRRAEKLAARLSEGDLARTVYEGGWNVKEVFAHLASMGASPAFFIGMGQRAASGQGGGGMEGFDVDEFNRQQVDMRKDRSLQELLAEYRQEHEQGIALMESTPDDVLNKQVPNFEGGMSTTLEMICGSCAEHEREHLDDVEAALSR